MNSKKTANTNAQTFSPDEREDIRNKKVEEIFDHVFTPRQKKEKENFVKKSKEPVTPEGLYDDFYEASAEVKKKIVETLDKDPSIVNLIKSTPGIGKTEAELDVLLDLASQGVMPFHAASTREQVWQAYDRMKAKVAGQGQKIVNLEGRHGGYIRERLEKDGKKVEVRQPPNCIHIEEIKKAREKGLIPQKAVCARCYKYPHFKSSKSGEKTGYKNACGYFKNFYEASDKISGNKRRREDRLPPIVVMTHAMAACVITDSELIEPEFLCFDEDFTSAMRETIAWDEDELQRIVDVPTLIKFRQLMRQSIRVAKRFKELSKYKEKSDQYKQLTDREKIVHKALVKAAVDGKTTTLSGINLYHVLEEAAYEIGGELEHILTNAAASDIGVSRGELIGMSEERFNQLSHAKEPELALELLSIVQDAKEEKETAYKVSLRKIQGTPWGFYWDHVRKIKYQGRMLILDAYGEKKIYERVCDREVEEIEVKCKMNENVTVYHDTVNTSRKQMDDTKNRLRLYYKYLVPILNKSEGKKVLIYTQKRYAKWLEDIIKRSNFGLKSLSIKWYWMDHGDNNYGDYDQLVLFGSAFSNVIGDMHLVNAMYAGEESVDFSTLKNGDYADERVTLVKKSRQENEMMQAIFRLRPAKPREEPKNINIMSRMRLPLVYEMPGAVKKLRYKPDFDTESITKYIARLYDHFGFYVHSMAPFIYEADLLMDWYDAGATNSDKSLFMTYDEFIDRYKIFINFSFYKRNAQKMQLICRDAKPGSIDFYGKNLAVWGDAEKARKFLIELRKEFYEPGCYDGDPFMVDEAIKENEHVTYEDAVKAQKIVEDQIGEAQKGLDEQAAAAAAAAEQAAEEYVEELDKQFGRKKSSSKGSSRRSDDILDNLDDLYEYFKRTTHLSPDAFERVYGPPPPKRDPPASGVDTC